MSQDKIKDWQQIAAIVVELRRQGKRIVFTNGCFDLLHSGHVRYLETARELGDVLIVGVNSDAGVRRLKGPQRPIVLEADRCIVLAGLACVDVVVLFDQETPYELIELIRPDVLVKGGDWAIAEIVGADIVLERGGRVLSLPYWKGHSSSGIIERVQKTLALEDAKG